MRRLVAIVAVVLLPTLFPGCSSDSTSPTPLTAAGTYNLVSVNGLPLPFMLQTSPLVELLNDQFVLLPNGGFTETGTVQTTNPTGQISTQPFTDVGTWTLNGATISLFFTGNGATATGVLSATSMTFTGAFSFVYAKI